MSIFRVSSKEIVQLHVIYLGNYITGEEFIMNDENLFACVFKTKHGKKLTNFNS